MFDVTFSDAPKEKDSDGEEEKEKKKKEGKGGKDEKVPKKEEKQSTGEHGVTMKRSDADSYVALALLGSEFCVSCTCSRL